MALFIVSAASRAIPQHLYGSFTHSAGVSNTVHFRLARWPLTVLLTTHWLPNDVSLAPMRPDCFSMSYSLILQGHRRRSIESDGSASALLISLLTIALLCLTGGINGSCDPWTNWHVSMQTLLNSSLIKYVLAELGLHVSTLCRPSAHLLWPAMGTSSADWSKALCFDSGRY